MTEQQIAITAPGNVIVSAGAGCGKTTTMIERIVNKLKNGASLTEMLIVTFTRASAADIRVKLAERLSALKREDGGKYFHIADEAIASMPECDIGTLHSFCQRLIKTYFFAAGIDPSATVIEESEAERIKLGCAQRAVSDALTSVDGFTEVYDMLCTRRGDKPVVDAIAETVDFALSLEDPNGYLSKDGFDDGKLDGILENRKTSLISRGEEIRAEAEAVGFTELAAILGEARDVLNGVIDGFTPIRFLPKSLEKKGESPSSIAQKSAVYEKYSAFKKDCAKFLSLKIDAEEAKKRDCTPYSRAIKETAKKALELYAAKKQRLGRTDYSDLEHGARRVLFDEGCRKEISERIKYVFIDEFQDVSPLQASIADCLSACGAEMFLVGDIKQSIYGFRRCSPEFFRRKFESDDNYTKVTLTKNYRSSRAVTDFVNNVFEGLMTPSFGGCDYTTNKLVCMSKEEGEAEYFTIDAEDEDDEDEDDTCGVYSVMRAAETDRYDEEAMFVAGKIGEYIEENTKKGGDFDLSSIAVLVRSTKGKFTTDLVRLLTESGVPCNVGKRSSLSDFPEAVALVDIARCVDDGCDDIALYTALRSPMGGFSDEELLEIAENGVKKARYKKVVPEKRGYAFWQKVAAYDGRLKNRLDGFKALRDEFSRYAACHSAADTLGRITSGIGYFQHVYEYYHSAPSAAAVDSLIRIASERRGDLHSFLDYAANAGFELGVSAGGNAVNITTIHSSKGLEYDYCIVADTARRFMMRDLSEKVIITDSSVATKVPETVDGKLKLMPSAPWLAEHLGGDRIREEELRLFYVALTRAKKKLTVCGKAKNRSGNINCEADFMKGGKAAEIKIIEHETPEEKTPENADGVEKAVRAACEFDYKKQKKERGEPIDRLIKTCVTAIAEDAGEDDYSSAAPVMTRDERWSGPADARLRGTAYHKAMELINFETPSFDKIKDGVENADLVDGATVERAALCMRALSSGAEFVARERYFMVDDGGTLVQGVIDLLILYKDGTAKVIDYKTSAAERLDGENYRTQLKLYAAAVEKTTPYKVTGVYLYSFEKGLIEVK